jgi:DNA invertase Pin-like site-specific DNA recombinase
MQAAEGHSLDAQRAEIRSYCARQGMQLLRVFEDVASGAKDSRPGLTAALEELERRGDVLVVFRLDRLSRSIFHFCRLSERHFCEGKKGLATIRENFRLDSAMARAVVNVVIAFAQAEREMAAERTRAVIAHLRANGYHHGKVPYGKRAVPAADSRFRVLVDEPAEQAILQRLREGLRTGRTPRALAEELNAEQVAPPQGPRWSQSSVYNLGRRHGWLSPKPHNVRPHSDEQVKARLVELRHRGLTLPEVARTLNGERWIPLKGARFTESNVRQLLGGCSTSRLLTPRRFLETVLVQLHAAQQNQRPGAPFERPSLARLARLLEEEGFKTPKGHSRWWPAQIVEVLRGKFDCHYERSRPKDYAQTLRELLAS